MIVPWSICAVVRAVAHKGSRNPSKEHVPQLQAQSPTQVCENQVVNYNNPKVLPEFQFKIQFSVFIYLFWMWILHRLREKTCYIYFHSNWLICISGEFLSLGRELQMINFLKFKFKIMTMYFLIPYVNLNKRKSIKCCNYRSLQPRQQVHGVL